MVPCLVYGGKITDDVGGATFDQGISPFVKYEADTAEAILGRPREAQRQFLLFVRQKIDRETSMAADRVSGQPPLLQADKDKVWVEGNRGEGVRCHADETGCGGRRDNRHPCRESTHRGPETLRRRQRDFCCLGHEMWSSPLSGPSLFRLHHSHQRLLGKWIFYPWSVSRTELKAVASASMRVTKATKRRPGGAIRHRRRETG